MKLSDYFENSEIIRDAKFDGTYHQHISISMDLIAFVDNSSQIEKINTTVNVTAVITLEKFKDKFNDKVGVAISPSPRNTFYNIHNILVKNYGLNVEHENHIDLTSDIGNALHIGKNVFIGKNVYLGYGVVIHDNTYIEDGVYIDDYSTIGVKGIQYPGTICAGGVRIGEGTEIRAYSIIGRPYQAFYTTIGKNCRVGQKVSIAHGSQIGDEVFLGTNSTLAGNCRIGNSSWIGLSATITDAIKVGESAIIRAGSVVINNIKANEEVSGNFAYNHKRNLMNFLKKKR